jgi:hypothetical protein
MDAEHQEKSELIQSLIESIEDRFNTIQVFTTSHDPATGETTYIGMGTGNFYARIGQIDEWLRMQKEIVSEKAKQIAGSENTDFSQN